MAKPHNHKSKITSKVLRSSGMTNSVQQWHKNVSAVNRSRINRTRGIWLRI